MKKRNCFIIALSAMVIFAQAIVPPAFADPTVELTDIQNHWAKTSIQLAVSYGSINGYPDGTYKPDNTITTAELLGILLKGCNAMIQSDSKSWSENIMNTAYDIDVISEDYIKKNEANQPISREKMAYILSAVAVLLLDEDVSEFTYDDFSDYIADSNSISMEYRINVLFCYKMGLTQGSGNGIFNGSSNLTRAEATVIANRLFDIEPRLTAVRLDRLMDETTLIFTVEWQNLDEYMVERIKEDIADDIKNLAIKAEIIWLSDDTKVKFVARNEKEAQNIFYAMQKKHTLEFRKSDGTVVLTGADLKRVEVMYYDKYAVDITFTEKGGKKFYEVTKELSQKKGEENCLTILLDGEIISAPNVVEPIESGKVAINISSPTLQGQAGALSLAQLVRKGLYPTFTLELE